MGYTTIESLKGKTAEELYAEECRLRGCQIDRVSCIFIAAVVYFVNTENPDPAKCKWWLWKDRPAAEADPRAQIDRLGRYTPQPRVPSAKCGEPIN